MDIKNIVDKAKDFVEEHKDDLKERGEGLKEDLAELKELENLGPMVTSFTKQLGSQLATLFAEIQTDELSRAGEEREA